MCKAQKADMTTSVQRRGDPEPWSPPPSQGPVWLHVGHLARRGLSPMGLFMASLFWPLQVGRPSLKLVTKDGLPFFIVNAQTPVLKAPT